MIMREFIEKIDNIVDIDGRKENYTLHNLNKKIAESKNYSERINLKHIVMDKMNKYSECAIIKNKEEVRIQKCNINYLNAINCMDIDIDDSCIDELTITGVSYIRLRNNTHIKKLYIEKCVLNGLYKLENSKIDKIYFCNSIYMGNNIDNIYEDSGIHNIDGIINNLYPIVPEEGSFIGFKKVMDRNEEYVIAKLLIPEDAKRSSGTTRKCRASKVKVLDMYYMNNKNKKCEEAYNAFHSYCNYCSCNCEKCELNAHDIFLKGTVYKIGKTIESDYFDENRWNKCTHGIHFLLTENEAIDYGV